MFYGQGTGSIYSEEERSEYSKKLKEIQDREDKEKEVLLSKISEENRERVIKYKVFITTDGTEFENNQEAALWHEKDLNLKSLFNFEASDDSLSNFSEYNFEEAKFAFLNKTYIKNPMRTSGHSHGSDIRDTYSDPEMYNKIDSLKKLRGNIVESILSSVLTEPHTWKMFLENLADKGLYNSHSGFIENDYALLEKEAYHPNYYNKESYVIRDVLGFIDLVSKEKGSILHDIKDALSCLSLEYVFNQYIRDCKKLSVSLRKIHERGLTVNVRIAYSLISKILFHKEDKLNKYELDVLSSEWDSIDESKLEKTVPMESYYLIDSLDKEGKTKYENKIKYYCFKSDLEKMDDVLMKFYKNDKEGFELLIRYSLRNAIHVENYGGYSFRKAGMNYIPKESLSFLFRWIEKNIPEYKLHLVNSESTMKSFMNLDSFYNINLTRQLSRFLIESLNLKKEEQNALERQLDISEIEELMLKGEIDSNNQELLDKIQNKVDEKIDILQEEGYVFVSNVAKSHSSGESVITLKSKEKKESFIKKCVVSGICYIENKYHVVTAKTDGVLFRKVEALNDVVYSGQEVKMKLSNIKNANI